MLRRHTKERCELRRHTKEKHVQRKHKRIARSCSESAKVEKCGCVLCRHTKEKHVLQEHKCEIARSCCVGAKKKSGSPRWTALLLS